MEIGRIKDKNRKEIKYIRFAFLIEIIFLLVNVISAELLISSEGVQYEDRILEEFNRLEGTNETFIEVIIYLRDTSQTDDVLSAFSSNELKDIINRRVSDRIGVKITEEGFFKLIQDGRVDKVYFSRKGHFLLDESALLINADDAWNTLGYTGDDIKVCVIDSGVDKYHSSLSGKILLTFLSIFYSYHNQFYIS